MKRLPILVFPAILLGGCVAMPYETDSAIYAGYPATVTAQAGSVYYYDTQRVSPYGYSYPAPYYGRPYPPQTYPYHRPPVYTPPAPVIVPPPMEFHYRRDAQPGWQNRPLPQHDQFRNGPQSNWRHPGTPPSNLEHRRDGRSDSQQREWGRKDWGQRDYGSGSNHRGHSYQR
ncbi:hypothetical protein EDC30_10833 [Paucimonas lemoignei]|uniref:Lipoprotein n=1 Tax=Paucimonas lemoignei TaxID=29443 RepID=A0A4V6NXY2_PAULE|nr:hypothetical protein [Paucimonas lemoignei]TCS35970.1 hypothetical protein EDC30_10833 [Paucimonas lemoignei]